MPKPLLAGIAVVIILGGLIYFAMSGQTATSCEVCIEYGGKAQCRSARAPDKAEAIKTATDNACSFLASGMNDTMSCGRVTPKSTKCE